MSEISRRFEEFIRSENRKLAEREQILPVKTEQGIRVGDVLIKNHDNLKTVTRGDTVYKDIFLNAAAVKIANLLALKKSSLRIEELYQADQIYGKWFVESQELLQIHRKLKTAKDHERADVIWAKYQESRDRAKSAKIKVDQLSSTPINKQ
jgi:hypothetical protein